MQVLSRTIFGYIRHLEGVKPKRPPLPLFFFLLPFFFDSRHIFAGSIKKLGWAGLGQRQWVNGTGHDTAHGVEERLGSSFFGSFVLFFSAFQQHGDGCS
jgi:hypothetical protein